MNRAGFLLIFVIAGGLIGCERNQGQKPAAPPAVPTQPSTPETPAPPVTPPVPVPQAAAQRSSQPPKLPSTRNVR